MYGKSREGRSEACLRKDLGLESAAKGKGRQRPDHTASAPRWPVSSPSSLLLYLWRTYDGLYSLQEPCLSVTVAFQYCL